MVRDVDKSLYEILEIHSDASQREIKQQYLKLTKKYHPDVSKDSGQERYLAVLRSYETLRNPLKRSRYDQELQVKQRRTIQEARPTPATAESGAPDDFNNVLGREPYKDIDKERLAREVQLLRNKKISTDFGELNLHETPMERGMSKYEKRRETFVRNFNERRQRRQALLEEERSPRSFQESSKENIELIQSAIKQKETSTHFATSQELLRLEITRRNDRIRYLSIVLAAVSGLFLYYTHEKKAYYREAKLKAERLMTESLNEMVCKEVRTRFQYD